MKHNKLLEVAMTKTVSQTSALEKFLKKNRRLRPSASAVDTEQGGDSSKTYVTQMMQEHSPIRVKQGEKVADADTTQYDLENINREVDEMAKTDAGEEESMEEMDQSILANLNIMKGAGQL